MWEILPPHEAKLNYSFFLEALPLLPNAMLAKLIRRAVYKKNVSATLPINVAFWGRGDGAGTKTVVKFRCGLRVTRVGGLATLQLL